MTQGAQEISKTGFVAPLPTVHPPCTVIDGHGNVVEPVTAFLCDLALNDASSHNCRSYAFDLLR